MRNVFLALIALLALTAPAAAQLEPSTTPLSNDRGEVIGTATHYGNQMYLRDAEGHLLYTMERSAKGLTMHDPNGKIVDFKVVDPGINRVLTPSDQRQKE